ncbi:hypothetical protein OS493_013546 [Desmophyllum pertusum]|uniref:Uncharacterized protein n=1 Tax=Desmophyllum pertusum TaxID=174260 RepID=A0A9X0DBP5_9CNID|nr:hypothetical protein OS493_013546 [Desmophyllum pertusum]
MEDASVRNPREKAGFLSLLTFSWINDILKLGSKQPLEEKHLFPVETSNQAERLVADLEMEWLAEERVSEQNRTKPRLWRAMMRVISNREYITLALFRSFYTITFILLPVIVWFFLKSISTASGISYKTTLPFVIGISLVAITKSASQAQAIFHVGVIAIRLKVASIGLILNLNRCTLEDTISENIINLVSNDAQAIEQLCYAVYLFSFSVLDIIASMALLWYLVAWQAMIGASFFLAVVSYGSFAAHKAGKVRHQAAAVTDKRLEIMKNIITGIRVVKMFAWEWNFTDLVAQIRRKEISLIRIRGFIVSSIYALFFTSSAIAGFISVMTLLLTETTLTSFKVFTLLSILANLKMAVTIFIAESLRYIADARTACNRMQRLIEKKYIVAYKMDHHAKDKLSSLEVYLKGRRYRPQFIRTESFRPGTPTLISARKVEGTSQNMQPQAFLENVSCFCSQTSEHPALQNVSLSATNGQLVGITGPVGSGKSSLLMSMLRELPKSSGKISCIGKIAFVSQTPWVYSGTVRENIVFGRQFDEQRYNKVIEVCDLEKDIARFAKRDLTKIGQRGVILSGGQRARVSLARAIYSDADIYLLDDPLSAVDAKNGSVVCQGTYSEIVQDKQRVFSLPSEAKQGFNCEEDNEQIVTVFSDETMNVTRADRDRVDLEDEEEDRMVGTVKWWLYWKYFRAALPNVLIASLAVFFAIVQVLWIAPHWWLSRMTEMPYEQQKNYITILVYGSIVTVSLVLTTVSSFCFYLAALKASENLHGQMTKAVMKAPVLFFDTNPVGRILNRFSKDIGSMDGLLPGQFLFAVQLCLYQDKNTAALILLKASKCWLALRGELLSSFLVTSVSAGALFATQSPGGCHHLAD